MELQLVIFRLGNEFFGVDIAAVESIVKMQTITRMPQTKDFIEGITNLRGKILPVMDLRKRFGLPAGEQTIESRIVVVSMPPRSVGLMVDGVEEVISLDDSLVEPPPPITTTVNADFIRGIAKTQQALIILLDLNQILSISEKDQLEFATAY